MSAAVNGRVLKTVYGNVGVSFIESIYCTEVTGISKKKYKVKDLLSSIFLHQAAIFMEIIYSQVRKSNNVYTFHAFTWKNEEYLHCGCASKKQKKTLLERGQDSQGRWTSSAKLSEATFSLRKLFSPVFWDMKLSITRNSNEKKSNFT